MKPTIQSELTRIFLVRDSNGKPEPESVLNRMEHLIGFPMAKKLKALGYVPTTRALLGYDKLAARFGSQQPKGGVVFKAPVVETHDSIFIDSYGRGCTTNAVGNPYRAVLMERGYWNRPMPFPADLVVVFKALIRAKETGKRVQFGLKSEPFPWLDDKYNVAKEILLMANFLDVQLEIFTCSDLLAREGYIEHLGANVTVTMRIPNEYDNRALRLLEPGAPSKLRRLNAMARLASESDARLKIFTELAWTVPVDLSPLYPVEETKGGSK